MIKVWIEGARPKTLIASVSPICIGSCFAWKLHAFSWWIFFCILLSGLFIQIGTNFANDFFDHQKGSDLNRIGPRRLMQSGLVSSLSMKRAIAISFLLASFFTIFLILKGGLVIAGFLILAILLGILYTAGPFSLAYLGLGDFVVFIFFGPIATGLTTYLLSGKISFLSFLAGCAPGAFSTGILIANNLRDRITDTKACKKTLVVRFGHRFGVMEYQMLMLLSFFVPLTLFQYNAKFFPCLICSLIPFLGLNQGAKLWKIEQPALIAPFLPRTAFLLTLYTIVFCLCILAR